ncbi:MAG: tRNA lysidine(34) synthetase TilS [Pseudomonadota bacterium]|nr:tRNA lysidine(34) synthetase TilS [Gammaproteobacteria bacterium]MBU1558283.1 tRNA lysidine(34) synthetase TilS [Gammaproteobacteria bacterium]MBU1628815.1 tRNA lysidine(34) synthetase TilS [Gammaproteobacteria bacterium]MBU1926612.1 tRNA lysidine(34) synthetase TilS [Gammaproteobacteria bacterium]MBU2545838.1 tRNA lysidine(34) synthetase TilS [Gammaproteobacteria bacterium]
MNILDTLYTHLSSFSPSSTVWIAYSGGVDSHVLLHACIQLRISFPALHFSAVHIHHGLLSEADHWVEHCVQVCQRLDIPLEVIRVTVDQSAGKSIEETAREARYQAFSGVLQDGDYLLTAHHQDDQAETCLLQFLRGAGVKGLAAMPIQSHFSKGYLVRPFLNLPKQHICDYASEHALQWIEDGSNHDERFVRNYLRYRMLPELKERWPSVARSLARVAHNCAEANQLLWEIGCEDVARCSGELQDTLSIRALKELTIIRRKNLLREWVVKQGFRLPSAAKLQRLMNDVLEAKEDATPLVSWQGCEVRRYQDSLFVLTPLLPLDVSQRVHWQDLEKPCVLPNDLGTVLLVSVQGKGIKIACLKNANKVSVRFRQGGEVLRLKGRRGAHALKKLFQEWHIPVWERDRIPLLYVDDALVAVGDYAIEESFQAGPEESGYVMEYQK